MKISNRQERFVAATPERVAAVIADFDAIWPTQIAPAPRRLERWPYEAGLMLWQEVDRPGAARALPGGQAGAVARRALVQARVRVRRDTPAPHGEEPSTCEVRGGLERADRADARPRARGAPRQCAGARWPADGDRHQSGRTMIAFRGQRDPQEAATGSDTNPRSETLARHRNWSGGTSSRRLGKRWTSDPMATRPSSRASGAPRQ